MTEDFVGLNNMKNSIAYMTSSDWKKRFIAEYAQLLTRQNNLIGAIWDIENGEEKYLYDCPIDLLDMQYEAMDEYKKILEIRATMYDIDIEKEIENLNR